MEERMKMIEMKFNQMMTQKNLEFEEHNAKITRLEERARSLNDLEENMKELEERLSEKDQKLEEQAMRIDALQEKAEQIPGLEAQVENMKRTIEGRGTMEEIIKENVQKELKVAMFQDWSYDPLEARYCVCDEVAHGDMVACDSGDCALKWFHYQCVRFSVVTLLSAAAILSFCSRFYM